MKRFIVTARILVEADDNVKAFKWADNETKHINVIEMWVEPTHNVCECGREMVEGNKNDKCFSCLKLENQEVEFGFNFGSAC